MASFSRRRGSRQSSPPLVPSPADHQPHDLVVVGLGGAAFAGLDAAAQHHDPVGNVPREIVASDAPTN